MLSPVDFEIGQYKLNRRVSRKLGAPHRSQPSPDAHVGNGELAKDAPVNDLSQEEMAKVRRLEPPDRNNPRD